MFIEPIVLQALRLGCLVAAHGRNGNSEPIFFGLK